MRFLAALIALSAVTSVAGAADVQRSPYRTTAQGEKVEVFALRNDHGMTVRMLSYGGILTEISVPDRNGNTANVVLALPDLKAYEARANFSSLLGRYANRIAGGGFMLDGKRYDLPGNADGISSHGGPRGFGARNWHGETFSDDKGVGVVLKFRSADGENGYPGSLSVAATFTLTQGNTLRIDYVASTDKPTVLNLSHHAYFNLAGDGSVYDHRVQILADRYTPIDARKVPTGQIDDVQGTPLDLRVPTRLRERVNASHAQIALARGFDHNFVLNKPAQNALTLAARITEPGSGRTLEVSTTEPGLQLYTANSFDGSLHDARGRPLARGAGMALETQHFPDSPNQPQFPSTVLVPGKPFRSTTEYRFGVMP
jgi:aldose 1-epimerase